MEDQPHQTLPIRPSLDGNFREVLGAWTLIMITSWLSSNHIHIWLVVWNMNFIFPIILGIIIPTDEHIFQRPPTITMKYYDTMIGQALRVLQLDIRQVFLSRALFMYFFTFRTSPNTSKILDPQIRTMWVEVGWSGSSCCQGRSKITAEPKLFANISSTFDVAPVRLPSWFMRGLYKSGLWFNKN